MVSVGARGGGDTGFWYLDSISQSSDGVGSLSSTSKYREGRLFAPSEMRCGCCGGSGRRASRAG